MDTITDRLKSRVPLPWDCRGRVVPAWIERDLKRLRALLGKAADEAVVAPVRERIRAMLEAFRTIPRKHRAGTVEKVEVLRKEFEVLLSVQFVRSESA
jgi:hypothetical protein